MYACVCLRIMKSSYCLRHPIVAVIMFDIFRCSLWHSLWTGSGVVRVCVCVCMLKDKMGSVDRIYIYIYIYIWIGT